ncbi:MAG: GtrA family protein [Cellulomonas sp.]
MTSSQTTLKSRLRHTLVQFGRFAVVGASGVVVNMVVLILVKSLGPHPELALFGLPPTEFHVRWYHLYSTLAFLVANLWNFQLNRGWTFRSSKQTAWWKGYLPFLVVGLLGQVIGLVLLTLLMHRGWPTSLPTDLLDDSSGLRTRLYWAQLIVIGVVTPLAFVLNKVWTFRGARTHVMATAPADEDDSATVG